MSDVSVKLTNKRINELVELLEKKHNISIIYLCEYGSRVLGYARPESDYDLCGIFVSTRQDYLNHNIFSTKLHILDFYDDRMYDFQLWNVSKVLKLFFESCNQTPLIWLRSPIVYKKHELCVQALTSFVQEKNKDNLAEALKHCHGVAINAYHNFFKEDCVKKMTICLYYLSTVEWMIQKKEVNYPLNVRDIIRDLGEIGPPCSPFLDKFDDFVRLFHKTLELRDSNIIDSKSALLDNPEFKALIESLKVDILPDFKSRIRECEKMSKNKSKSDLAKEEYCKLFEQIIDYANP